MDGWMDLNLQGNRVLTFEVLPKKGKGKQGSG